MWYTLWRLKKTFWSQVGGAPVTFTCPLETSETDAPRIGPPPSITLELRLYARRKVAPPPAVASLKFFFVLLSSLELSDTTVYEPCIRAHSGTVASVGPG